jgi:hypothetical protein
LAAAVVGGLGHRSGDGSEGGLNMGVTDDRNDPGLNKIEPDGMQEKYLVLSEEERAKGFVRPVRRAYVHLKCGSVTTMGPEIAETYARDPHFYGGTFCAHCRNHYPVGEQGEFIWDDGSGQKVGT